MLTVAAALNRGSPGHPPAAYVTELVVPDGGLVELDEPAVAAMGVRVRRASTVPGPRGPLFEPVALIRTLADILVRDLQMSNISES